jgi:hypothetical protein
MKSRIAAYNTGLTIAKSKYDKKEVPVNPKNFPTKAIFILIPLGDENTDKIELYFDPRIMQWKSNVIYNNTVGKLTPDQFGQFFNSEFYTKLLNRCKASWPLKDTLYNDLFNGLCKKSMATQYSDDALIEDDDKETSKSEKTHTASGRKIVSFSDNLVSSSNSKFFCWPNIEENKLYRWSTWKDYKKIKPLCKLRFKHGDIFYGITINVYNDDIDLRNRGFRCYSLEEPPVQWLSSDECESLIKLSVIQRFVTHCASKITKYVNMDAEEIYKKINNKDKITVNEIKATQNAIRKTCNQIIKNKQLESYIWS